MPRQCVGEEQMQVGTLEYGRRCERPAMDDSDLCANHYDRQREGAWW